MVKLLVLIGKRNSLAVRETNTSMYKFGHVGVNLALYVPIGALLILSGLAHLVLGGAAVMVGLATLPDIDQRIPRIKHRGVTHTIWFAFLIGLTVGVVAFWGASAGRQESVVAGLLATYALIGHLLADVITPLGLTPFYPLSKRHYTLNLVHAKNQRANRALLFTGSVVFSVFAYVFVF